MWSRRTPLALSAESAREPGLPPSPTTDGGIPSPPFWAKITGQAAGTSRYAWTQLDEGDTAAFDTGLSELFAAAGTSAADGAPAYEINGRTDIIIGTRIQLWPGGDLTFYLFAAPATEGAVIGFAEVDGSPSYTGISTLRVDQADGFVLTQPAAGIARLDLASASTTQAGKVDTTTQGFAGVKSFNPGGFGSPVVTIDTTGVVITGSSYGINITGNGNILTDGGVYGADFVSCGAALTGVGCTLLPYGAFQVEVAVLPSGTGVGTIAMGSPGAAIDTYFYSTIQFAAVDRFGIGLVPTWGIGASVVVPGPRTLTFLGGILTGNTATGTLPTLSIGGGGTGQTTAAAALAALGGQPVDATLTAFGALTITPDSLTIGTGADAFSQVTFGANTFPAKASTGGLVAQPITDFGLSLVAAATAALARAALGVGAPDDANAIISSQVFGG